MSRLRRVDCATEGITRRRRGRGFDYVDQSTGERIEDEELLSRVRALAIPPAWQEVWICADPLGHIQATGMDARGRKQYRYHDRWRERRDRQKFEDMLDFANALPKLRGRVERDLGKRTISRDRVRARAIRLLDRGLVRIGSEDYAVENETYGLATMRKRHVSVVNGFVVFDYPAKHGKRQIRHVVDPEVAAVVEALKRRRGGLDELLAYKDGRRWVDVKSADINAYVKEATGEDFSAKDFRTWGATVLAAVGLAVSPARDTQTARKRAVTRMIKEVAHHLGNTPAVARASYIDPRVIDRYLDGVTIRADLVDIGETAIQGDIEAAVIDLIEDYRGSELVEDAA